MGYKKKVIYWCDACGGGGKLVNTLVDDSLKGIKNDVISCGWKVNDGNKFLCDKCIEKGKTFDDCVGYIIQ